MAEDLRYRKDLELLSSLGESALLVINSINITPEDDDRFDEILDAGCKVIFVSNYCYDGYCTYDLKEFRSTDISLELIKKFYDYKPDERDALFSILTALAIIHSVYIFMQELWERDRIPRKRLPKS